MGAHSNAAPVIIKRRKVISGGGHHGGAWKVAYADFVTAMMAFFMLMWLLNATTEQQRKGIADYFSPTIPINRVSGGGNGAFNGDSIFSEETLPKDGIGASAEHATREDKARGDSGTDDLDADNAALRELFEDLDERLRGHGGESAVMENQLRHVVTRLTDEGLVIELFDLEGLPLFEERSTVPRPLLHDLAVLVADAAGSVTNRVAVEGHVRAEPVMLLRNPVWELSAERAEVVRQLLDRAGLPAQRVRRVTGHADREPAVGDPMAVRNNRIEIILLRK